MTLGEYSVTAEIVIDRPPEAVFDFVSDPENDPRWCALVPEVTRVGDQEAGSGAYRFVQRFGPTTSEGTGEIVTLSRPTHLRSRSSVMGGDFDTTYDLEAVGEATRFVHTNRVRWSGAFRLMHPVQKWFSKRIMKRQLGALKVILEADA